MLEKYLNFPESEIYLNEIRMYEPYVPYRTDVPTNMTISRYLFRFGALFVSTYIIHGNSTVRTVQNIFLFFLFF